MMRITLALAAIALTSFGANAQDPLYELGTYRYGGTYNVINTADAQSCSVTCGRDQACFAWSFQPASPALEAARCELKQSIGKAITNPLTTSGINPHIAAQSIGNGPVPLPPGTLRGAPSGFSSPPPRTNIARPAPAPFTPQPRAVQPPTPPENGLPPGAILRDAPPPDISFTPLEPIAPAPAAGTRQLRAAPSANPTPAPTRPYDQIRERKYPTYSVSRDSATTSEDLEAASHAEDTTDKDLSGTLNLDTEDLASDIGDPVPAERDTLRRRGGAGS